MNNKMTTVEEYAKYLEDNPKAEIPLWWDRQCEVPHYPIVGVSATAADAFAKWSGGRLPTEDEWVANWKNWDGYGLFEWTSTIEPGGRVARGGSWLYYARLCRTAYLDWDYPVFRITDLGFRVLGIEERRMIGRGLQPQRIAELEASNKDSVVALCPNCQGQTIVSRPPWIAGDQETWTASSTEPYPCPTCSAKGYIVAEQYREEGKDGQND